MKTAVSVPDPLFKAAERLSRKLRISRSEVFQRALRAYVQEHDAAAVTAALNELYGNDGSVCRLDPILDRLQVASLSEDDW